ALIDRTAWPSDTRLRSSAITSDALRSVFFHSWSRALSIGRTRSEVGGRSTPLATPPERSSFTSDANSSRLSRSHHHDRGVGEQEKHQQRGQQLELPAACQPANEPQRRRQHAARGGPRRAPQRRAVLRGLAAAEKRQFEG